jgi:hypothetical protein
MRKLAVAAIALMMLGAGCSVINPILKPKTTCPEHRLESIEDDIPNEIRYPQVTLTPAPEV